MIGLEPTRLTAPDPKSGAAANYATSARRNFIKRCKDNKFSRFGKRNREESYSFPCGGSVTLRKARALSIMVSMFFASSSGEISTLMSGSMPHSICSMSTLKCGLAEKRTVHPLGNSEVKGMPEPPPVLSPMMVTLGRQRI